MPKRKGECPPVAREKMDHMRELANFNKQLTEFLEVETQDRSR